MAIKLQQRNRRHLTGRRLPFRGSSLSAGSMVFSSLFACRPTGQSRPVPVHPSQRYPHSSILLGLLGSRFPQNTPSHRVHPELSPDFAVGALHQKGQRSLCLRFSYHWRGAYKSTGCLVYRSLAVAPCFTASSQALGSAIRSAAANGLAHYRGCLGYRRLPEFAWLTLLPFSAS